jgi:hypothetical protein
MLGGLGCGVARTRYGWLLYYHLYQHLLRLGTNVLLIVDRQFNMPLPSYPYARPVTPVTASSQSLPQCRNRGSRAKNGTRHPIALKPGIVFSSPSRIIPNSKPGWKA